MQELKADVRAIKSDINSLESRMDARIANLKTSLLLTMSGFAALIIAAEAYFGS